MHASQIQDCIVGHRVEKVKTWWILMTAQIYLGLLPQMPTAYFSPSLLVPIEIDTCLFLWLILELFVLIVCHFTEMDLDNSIDFCRKSFYSRLCCQCVLGLTCTFAKLIDLCLLLFSGAVFGKTERNKSLVNMHNSCISWSCYKLFSFVRWSTLSVLLNVVLFIVHV